MNRQVAWHVLAVGVAISDDRWLGWHVQAVGVVAHRCGFRRCRIHGKVTAFEVKY